jgi:hypothetical protein
MAMSDAADLHLPIVAPGPTYSAIVPAIVADTHPDAGERLIEFFAATIRNANTRTAYMNAVADFLAFAPVAALGSSNNSRRPLRLMLLTSCP